MVNSSFDGLQSIITEVTLEITKVSRKTSAEPFKGLGVGDIIKIYKNPFGLEYSRRGGGAVSVGISTKNGKFNRYMSDLERVLNIQEDWKNYNAKIRDVPIIPPTYEFKLLSIENFYETE
ncbi:hypothetical protein cd3_047 [Carnobacterium phage cd3]|uniref:Uncharacterized protein n=2 Tax=Carnodivirus TaxID=3044682 RepID=A0AAE7SQQ2_9CAUD|nr:hypothetical protein PQD68_gp047 [Carnobacterium phage cd2]YP_010676512.1 hypothetical protein PQD69_gp046 [Carnobacterium phage cd4]QXP45173.1 hypothetical protein cd2_047 [Carnobacterium phage cd2]QXP45271.1 hypothetical protein cd3_047 [Carnobacterium phage cd3]QXP45355.1 hypothetical protein cd4_046 [Carnobacterium phage cd4]